LVFDSASIEECYVAPHNNDPFARVRDIPRVGTAITRLSNIW
jgi:hypothetical protein